nr:MAG TPA: hypothetical protein [Caudoviricetes sp.]
MEEVSRGVGSVKINTLSIQAQKSYVSCET